MTAADLTVLRALAREIAEDAALPVQQERIRQWKALNALRPERPMVMVDQVPWDEMDVDGELTLRSEDPFHRRLETGLRRQLYGWRHMRADMVVLPVIVIPKVVGHDGFGVAIETDFLTVDAERDLVIRPSASGPLPPSLDDPSAIRTPSVWLEAEATAEREARAREVFDGILDVQMQGILPCHATWDEIVQLRDPIGALVDLATRPDEMHEIARRWSDARLAYVDRLEAQGLLGHGQQLVHCTGAFTDELPAEGFDPTRPRARDIWTCGMAQALGDVSPAMHAAFELPCAQAWYARFGLGYYGCCEPLHDRIDMVRRIPNVRKISISPWADVAVAAGNIAGDYVMSRKPSPFFLALDAFDLDGAEAEIRASIAACRATGTPLEIILKDITTVHGEPERLWAWERLAMELVGA